MASKILQFQEIANAIRAKSGKTDPLKPKNFAQAITDIPSATPYVAIIDVKAPKDTLVVGTSDKSVVQAVAGADEHALLQITQPGTYQVVGILGSQTLGPALVSDVAVFEVTVGLVPLELTWNSIEYIGLITPFPSSVRYSSGARANDVVVFIGYASAQMYTKTLEAVALTLPTNLSETIPMSRDSAGVARFLYPGTFYDVDNEGVVTSHPMPDGYSVQSWVYDEENDRVFISTGSGSTGTWTSWIVDAEGTKQSIAEQPHCTSYNYQGYDRVDLTPTKIWARSYESGKGGYYSREDFVLVNSTLPELMCRTNLQSPSKLSGNVAIFAQSNTLVYKVDDDGTLSNIEVPATGDSSANFFAADLLHGAYVVVGSSNSYNYNAVQYQCHFYLDRSLVAHVLEAPVKFHGWRNTVILGDQVLLGPGNAYGTHDVNVELYQLVLVEDIT